MTYTTNKNEELRPSETFQDGEERGLSPDTRLTPAHVEEVFVHRKNMLASIKANIEPRLHEAILIKMDYEHTSLLNSMEDDRRARELKKGANKILDARYFIQRPLETRTF